MTSSARLAAINLLLGAATVGCNAPSIPSSPPTAESTPAEPAKEEKPMVAGAPGEAVPEDETPVTDIPRKFDSHDPIHGRRSRRAGGYLGTTMATIPYAKFQTMIISIDEANVLYNAEHGDWPKSQEEFVKKIVEFNQITLPEIPEDEEYCYVSEQGDVGLQIRLKPGSPRSKVPAGTSPQEAMKLLGVDINAVPPPPPRSKQWSGDSSGAKQPAGQTAPAGSAQAEEPADEPSPDIRTRAEQLGKQGDEKAKDHALAPGGLAPAGGLEEK